MRAALATCVLVLAATTPTVAQELRLTLDKIKETGVIQLGHREASPPFSFLDKDGKTSVWVVDPAAMTVATRPVTLAGKESQGMVTIGTGVDAGMRVVTAGVHSLEEGQHFSTGTRCLRCRVQGR